MAFVKRSIGSIEDVREPEPVEEPVDNTEPAETEDKEA